MNIALIDDDTTTLSITELMLKKTNAITSADSVEKYKTIEDFHNRNSSTIFDVIICDQDFGILSSKKGFDFLKALVNNGFKGKPVLLTADDSVSMGLKMSFEGRLEYVTKNMSSGDKNVYKMLGEIIKNARNEA